ncbi:hypothetical protein LOK49_LG09G00696 [Camellia lanceoleosa]|uniref:Uncharacterized protein n=1 Tax=Camellia lanceoleosa TaxID=1840588 RepID=A0ACC0GK74_9ERIC|nr:hypothetical protein LOK49_LG09G00696 [Camellia lanceoleosa]
MLLIFNCVQGYHRDILEHWAPPPPGGTIAVVHPPPPPPPPIDKLTNKTSPEILTQGIETTAIRKIPTKRGREKKSSSKHHRKVAAGSRDRSSS